MKKYLLFSSLLCASLHSWGERYGTYSTSAPSDTHFPLNAHQGWFITESYLLMKPFLGALEIGDRVSAAPSDFKIKVKEPTFQWNSAVRVGIGRYLPNHDKWDVNLYSTYFYGDSKNRSRGNLNQKRGLSPSYSAFVFFLSEKTTSAWRLNYFISDLLLGRQFSMTPRITLHPYIGLRGGAIFNDFKSHSAGTANVPDIGPFAAVENIKLREYFWGIGPRVGTNWDYKFSGDFSFLGNFAGSLLYGHYHVKEKSFSTAVIDDEPLPIFIKSFDHDDTLRVNFDCALGIGWERWFRNNTLRFAPTFQFEGTLWLDMNDFFNPLGNFTQDHGDLGLMGFSFNLQLDF